MDWIFDLIVLRSKDWIFDIVVFRSKNWIFDLFVFRSKDWIFDLFVFRSKDWIFDFVVFRSKDWVRLLIRRRIKLIRVEPRILVPGVRDIQDPGPAHHTLHLGRSAQLSTGPVSWIWIKTVEFRSGQLSSYQVIWGGNKSDKVESGQFRSGQIKRARFNIWGRVSWSLI